MFWNIFLGLSLVFVITILIIEIAKIYFARELNKRDEYLLKNIFKKCPRYKENYYENVGETLRLYDDNPLYEDSPIIDPYICVKCNNKIQDAFNMTKQNIKKQDDYQNKTGREILKEKYIEFFRYVRGGVILPTENEFCYFLYYVGEYSKDKIGKRFDLVMDGDIQKLDLRKSKKDGLFKVIDKDLYTNGKDVSEKLVAIDFKAAKTIYL